MNRNAYRDADTNAAHYGNKRTRLARWWRPLSSAYCAGGLVFTCLYGCHNLGMISVDDLYPWGWTFIVSALCQMVTLPFLLILIPLDVYWERMMRRAFQQRRDVAREVR